MFYSLLQLQKLIPKNTKIMESRKALIDYIIGNEFISKPELQQKFIDLLDKHEQALQLQQTGVNGSFCSNCRWFNSCAIRIDYNVDTCEEHEF